MSDNNDIDFGTPDVKRLMTAQSRKIADLERSLELLNTERREEVEVRSLLQRELAEHIDNRTQHGRDFQGFDPVSNHVEVLRDSDTAADGSGSGTSAVASARVYGSATPTVGKILESNAEVLKVTTGADGGITVMTAGYYVLYLLVNLSVSVDDASDYSTLWQRTQLKVNDQSLSPAFSAEFGYENISWDTTSDDGLLGAPGMGSFPYYLNAGDVITAEDPDSTFTDIWFAAVKIVT